MHVCRVPVPAPKDLDENPEEAGTARWAQPWFARELPMSVEVLMENALDPSHVSFAHHGITPCARPLTLSLIHI